MCRIKLILWLLFSLFVLLSVQNSPVFCGEIEEDYYEDEGNGSFYDDVLYGKYNLMEEDFIDVPHRLSRFDYIREDLEDIRVCSRPDEEFAVLNLQWKNDLIFINDFKTVAGKMKSKRGVPAANKGIRYFYRLLSDRDGPVYEQYFNIPIELHFDFPEGPDGDLAGGTFKRSETDFTIRIPLSDKSVNRVMFFKKIMKRIPGQRIKQGEDLEPEKNKLMLGDILF